MNATLKHMTVCEQWEPVRVSEQRRTTNRELPFRRKIMLAARKREKMEGRQL